MPRNRLKWVPASERLAHEYCYFLHDQAVAILKEYEVSQAHLIKFEFSPVELERYELVAAEHDPVTALEVLGRHDGAKRVYLNTITLGLVSDCLHHVFEALRCMERRKVVVALNLLRKPLLDSLVYMAWMLGDEDDFYRSFKEGSPDVISTKHVGNKRKAIFQAALEMTELGDFVSADWLIESLFDASNQRGLYPFLQRAVHLVTVMKEGVRTEPENFNFIFKDFTDDDSYEGLYSLLPAILLFLTHVTALLYDRIAPMDPGAKTALVVRTKFGLHIVEGTDDVSGVKDRLNELAETLECCDCGAKPTMTKHNMARLVMTESFRCSSCGVRNAFPFAWLF